MGLNDPQWGGNKNGGPPDLEELLRKLNAKVAALLNGTKKNDDQGGDAKNTPPRPVIGGGAVGLIIGIAVLLWVGSGFYMVSEGEQGIVLRFGKKVDVTGAGPHLHLPAPIESVEIVNLSQVRTMEVGYRGNVKNKQLEESLMLTDDENIVDVQFAVQYTIRDPAEYLFNNFLPARNKAEQQLATDTIVRQAAETAVREVVGRSKMDFVLNQGREQIAAEATKLIQSILERYKSGIVVSKLTMQNAQPPEQVQAAFDDAVKAGQDRERQKNEGQAYANDVVPRAKGTAARLIEESQGYKQSVIANAEGDASRFKQILVEYEKAPGVTRDRMYIDMMQQVMSNISKVMVDQKNGNSLLYLPLDKLIETSRAAAPTPVAVEATSAVVSSAGNDNVAAQRARDALLSRDREAR